MAYQNHCKKCGSVDLFAEASGNNTGLYCSDCGAWIKWMHKNELRAFEKSKETQNRLCEGLAECNFNKLCAALDDLGIEYKDENGFLEFSAVMENIANKWKSLYIA